ncbi:MAG: CPA2 family monovalent cation:H+ antiporter-2 [Verrucomicrobiales bacterium]|jgi:CPA2 family monovalent cation:H+ antiporter-2
MPFETGFSYALIYLVAALVAVLVGRWTGIGAVLGYLIAGAAIGPWGLSIIGEEGEHVTHFAEFGVVLMLFLIGLELSPEMLWRMRRSMIGLGGSQVALSALAIAGLAMAFGLGWKEALAVGFVLAPSSTAIVLQSLSERGLRQTEPGRDAFSVLLFQDVAVIPLIALLPLLGTSGGQSGDPGHGSAAWMEHYPEGVRALLTFGAIIGVIALAWLGMRPLFRAVAHLNQREAFTAAALLLVISVALVMTKVGLSPALGAFIAGVVLAGSEYRHELEADLEPFKALLLGLFFMGVGMGIDFGHISANIALVFGITLILLLVKGLLVFGLAKANGAEKEGAFLTAAALAAGGEFAFVLIKVALGTGAIAGTTAPTIVAAVALSMATTPLLILLIGKFYHRFQVSKAITGPSERRAPDVTDEGAPVIICGFGRFGHTVGRLLRGQGFACSVLDRDADQVDLLRELGIPIHYGDASRPDLLEAAGAGTAKVLVVALKDRDANLKIARTARELYPNLQIYLRAHGRIDAYEFIDAGEELVYRDTLDSSLRMGTDILQHLGMDEQNAISASSLYREGDEAAMREVVEHRHDRKRYLSASREAVRALDDLMRRESPCVSKEKE